MITNSNYCAVSLRWRWPLLLIGVLLAIAAGGAPMRGVLAYDRAAIADGQLWRLLTGHFVHLGWYHSLLNVAALLVLVLLCPQALPARTWVRRLLVLALGISVCLYVLAPDVTRYAGMSGVVHGLFLLGLVPQLRRRNVIAGLALVYLVGKLAYEQLAGAPLSDAVLIGGRVITDAHLYGALVALAYGLIAGSFSGRERMLVPSQNSS